MRFLKSTTLLILVCLFGACKKNELKLTYKLAGDNKSELQKAITHFSENPEDSLKLQAAEFLIKQMQFNYALQKLQASNDSIKNRFLKLHQNSKEICTGDSIIPWSVLRAIADTFRQASAACDKVNLQKEVLIDARQIKGKDLKRVRI